MKYLLVVSCLAMSVSSIAAKNQNEVAIEETAASRAYENLTNHQEKGINKRASKVTKSSSGKAGKRSASKAKVIQ